MFYALEVMNGGAHRRNLRLAELAGEGFDTLPEAKRFMSGYARKAGGHEGRTRTFIVTDAPDGAPLATAVKSFGPVGTKPRMSVS